VTQARVLVTYLPFERSTRVPAGTTLFSAAHWIGLPIESTCGGHGTCGKCRVRLADGGAEVTPADRRQLAADDLEAGWRLSCQARAQADTVCDVPRLQRVPRAATMGLNRLVLLDPNVRKVLVELAEPTLEDQRSDAERLRTALAAEGHDMVAGVRQLRELPGVLRSAAFQVTAVLAGDRLVAVEPGDTREECYGVAVDLGTTTVVGTLMNLRTGMAEAVRSTLNGQAPFGADVISRVSHAMRGDAALEELRAAALASVNGILAELLEATGVPRDRVYEAVVVGNATMLHLLLGIDPAPIAVVPFAPAFREALDLPAAEVGVAIHAGGRVQTLPLLGAYVGADIVGGVLATGLARDERLRVFVDVGTNGEVVVGSARRVLATAAPAGPAFEGSQIRCGMRATDGAIEGVTLGEGVELQVIGGDPVPRGICGSGLVDAVAQLRLAGLVDASGRLRSAEEAAGHPLAGRLVTLDGVRAFRLADGVHLTQKDIRELQFGKGSIATGIRVLMDLLAVTAADVDEVLLGGSFGSYLNPASARIIGLVPPVEVGRILSAGNTAGEGAKMALLSFRERRVATELPAHVEYVELSGRPDFNDTFVSMLAFPELSDLSEPVLR
jgi:uncharacterized 2Fe-2S/4Fe-4S cluster protein (DUF4445 family)